jgi:large subunit ribosomal protein L18
MSKAQKKRERRTRAHLRVRKSVSGTSERPRLAVFKSLRYVYAQVIDDTNGKTLVQASSREAAVVGKAGGSAKTKAAARKVGEIIADRAKGQGIAKVVFDRGGYVYHGKVKEIAEGARSKGLEF